MYTLDDRLFSTALRGGSPDANLPAPDNIDDELAKALALLDKVFQIVTHISYQV